MNFRYFLISEILFLISQNINYGSNKLTSHNTKIESFFSGGKNPYHSQKNVFIDPSKMYKKKCSSKKCILKF